MPLPYFLDASDFEDAWTVAAAVPPVPPDAVHVLAFWYVHVVLFFVSFAGFMPGVDADAFVPALAEPETCAWPCVWPWVWVDAVAACCSWPGAVADLPLPGSASAVAPKKADAATAHAQAAARRA